MTVHQLRKQAEKENMPFDLAIKIRMKMLHELMIEWDEYIESTDALEIPALEWNQIIDELIAMREALKHINDIPTGNLVTQEMIEQAREVPITDVVEFIHGKVKCFNHEDDHPSAFHGTRTNTMQCPVCATGWGPIDVLMKRDGMEFSSAVRSLICR